MIFEADAGEHSIVPYRRLVRDVDEFVVHVDARPTPISSFEVVKDGAPSPL